MYDLWIIHSVNQKGCGGNSRGGKHRGIMIYFGLPLIG